MLSGAIRLSVSSLVLCMIGAVPQSAGAEPFTPEENQEIAEAAAAKAEEIRQRRLAAQQEGPPSDATASSEVVLSSPEEFGQFFFGGIADVLGEPSLRLFQPNARIYFDVGDDDDGEADIFEDGALVPTITLAEIRFSNRLFSKTKGQPLKESDRSNWTWGFATGLGASIAAETGEDSTAPILLATVGMFLEYEFRNPATSIKNLETLANATKALGLTSSNPTVGFEAGWAYGVSADENFEDNDDSAFYVGVTAYFPF
ncbi:MAG: hypothetical protein AAGI68_12385 [Planctomycetota bacterium]